MNDEVRMAVDAELSVIREYYEVPDQFRDEYRGFLADVMAAGEESSSYMDFEEKYAAAGLDKRMETLMLKCTLRPQKKMTAKETLKAAKNAYKSTADTGAKRGEWLKQGLPDVGESVGVYASDEMLHQSLERRTAFEEEHPEAHEARNTVNAVRNAAWHLFGKKKK